MIDSIVLGALFAFSAATLRPVQAPTAVFDLAPVNVLAIKARVKGTPMVVHLDSGSSGLRVHQSTLDLLTKDGLTLPIPSLLVDLVGKSGHVSSKSEQISNEILTLGVAQSDGSASMTQQADMLLGLEFLRHVAIGIDPQKNELAVFDQGHVGKDARNAWLGSPNGQGVKEVSLGERRATDGWSWYTVKWRVNGVPTELILDTGTSFITIDEKAGRRRGLNWIAGTDMSGLTENMRGGYSSVGQLQTEWATFSPWVIALTPTVRGVNVPTLAGLDVLTTGKTLIDFPAKKMYVLPIEPSHDVLWMLARYGLRIVIADGRPRLAVGTATPAANAGLQDGDVLLEVNGQTVDYGDHTSKADDLKSKDGKSLEVKVRRGTQTLDVHLTTPMTNAK